MNTLFFRDMITKASYLCITFLLLFFYLVNFFCLGQTSTSIGEEKKYNPRLKQDKENFILTMKNLNLVYPRLIDVAVPANMVCGIYEPKEQAKQ